MAEKQINPILKQVLEFGPTIAFFIIYLRMRDNTYELFGHEYSGFIVAALVFVPLLLASIGALWALTGELSRMQIFVAVMVVLFGGLTAWFNDERFFKMKTTIVYSLFAGLLGIGLLRGKSWLRFVMKDVIPMKREGWMILTRRLCAAFAVLAVANEVVWRTMSTDTWVKIETFVFPIALAVFIFWQITALSPYLIEDKKEGEGAAK